jgi:hypothetical protein
MEHLPFAQSRVNDCADKIAIALDFFWSNHDHIFREAHTGNCRLNFDGELPSRPRYRHHDQKVHIAIRSRSPASVRAEEDDLLRVETLNDAANHLADYFLGSVVNRGSRRVHL